MLQSLVVNILNKFLSDFIENLDSKQLNISLFSGKVTLNNLLVRRKILDNLPLPFKLSYGRVGQIKVDIPVTSLSSKPLKIDVSDVFVILKVKSLDDWKENVEVEAYQQSIVESLDTAENADMSSGQIKKNDQGYFAKLVAKVVDNVQINVRNIYVRLEDTLSYPQTPWAMGVMLAELSMTTSSSSWVPKFVVGEELMRKSLKIKDLALFLNYGPQDKILFEKFGKFIEGKDPEIEFGRIECSLAPIRPRFLMANNFIINPFQIEARITLNKNVSNLKPQLEGFLAFGGFIDEKEKGSENRFAAQIDQKQISVLLRLAEYIGLYNTFKEAVLSQFIGKQLSGEERSAYENLYLEYYFLVQNKKTEKAKKLRDELKQTEVKYSFQKMYLIRQITLKRYDLEKKIQVQNIEVQKRIEKAKKKLKSKTKAQKLLEMQQIEEQLKSESAQLVEEEQAQFDSEIEQLLESQKGLNEIVLKTMPKEWVRFKFGLDIPQIKFTLKKTQTQRFFGVVIDHMSLGAQVGGLNWVDVNFSISNFNVVDLYSKCQAFPYLVESVFGEAVSESKMLRAFLRIHPIDEESDVIIRIRNQAHFFIIGNLVTLLAVKQMFIEAVAKQGYDFSYYTTAIAQKAKFYIANGRQAVQNYLNSQSQEDRQLEPPVKVDLDINMNPPVLFLPVSIYDPNTACLAIDFGKFRAKSHHLSIKKDLDYRQLTEIKNLYNCYQVGLEGFSVKLMERMHFPYKEIKNLRSVKASHTLLSEFNLYFKFYDCVDKRNTKMPNNIMHLDFSNLDILVTDQLVMAVYSLYTNLMAKINEAETQGKTVSRLLKDTPEQVKKISELKALNEVQNQRELDELEKIEELGDRIDRSQSFSEYAESEKPEIQKKRLDRILQEIMVSVSRVNIFIAQDYSSQEESQGEYQTKLEQGIMLPIVKKPVRELVEVYVSGVEVALLMTSEQNLGVNYQFQGCMQFEKQKLKPVIAYPYNMILSSPEVEKQFQESGINGEQAIQGDTMLQMRTRKLVDTTIASLSKDRMFQEIAEYASTPDARSRFREMLSQHKCQLEVGVIVQNKENNTAVSFIVQRLRLVSGIPFFSKLAAFLKHLIPTKESPQAKEEEVKQETDEHTDELQGISIPPPPPNLFREESKVEEKQIQAMNQEKLRKMANKRIDLKKVVQITKVRLQGSIGGIEIWVPRDPSNEYSRVFAVSVEGGCSFRQRSEVQLYYDAETNFFKNKITTLLERSADACVYDLGIKMYNRHLLDPDKANQEVSIERLLQPSRFIMAYSQSFALDSNVNKRNINLTVEPLDLQVGFRELDFFYDVVPQYLNFLDSSEPVQQQPIQELGQVNKPDETEPTKSKEEEFVAFSSDEIFKQSETWWNINFQLDKIEFALNDDTGSFEYPLMRVQLNDLRAKTWYSQIQTLNIVQKTIKMLCERKKDYDFRGPDFTLNAGFTMQAYYYNLQVAEYEPLLEPWAVEVKIIQDEEASPLNIIINAPKVINLNLTFGMALAVNKFKERMGERGENWENELEIEKLKQKDYKSSYALEITKSGQFEKKKINTRKQEEKVEESSEQQNVISKFELNNELGLPILLWDANELLDHEIISNDEELTKQPNILKFAAEQKLLISQKDLEQLTNANRKKLGISKALKEQIASMAVKIPLMKPIPRIPIEISGTYGYKLDPQNPKGMPESLVKEPVSFIVKTSPEDNTKFVFFCSCVSFSNNTYLTIKAYGIKMVPKKQPDRFLTSINKEIAKEFTLRPNEVFTVPLAWMLDELAIVIQVYYEGRSRYEVLFNNVKACFDSVKYKKRLNSKMVAYNLDGDHVEKNIYISCDIAAFKCLPSKDPNVPPEFLVNFNPPLCVQNLFAEVGSGLEGFVMAEGLLREVGKVPRGQIQYFYDIDPYSKYCNHNLYFSFPVTQHNRKSFLLRDSEEQYVFQSEKIKLARLKTNKEDPNKQKLSKCCFEMYKGKKFNFQNGVIEDPTLYNPFELVTELVPFNILNTYGENFYLRDKVFESTSAQKLIVFPECQVVNRTPFLFKIKAPSAHASEYSSVLPFNRALYSAKDDSKITVKTEGFNWSNKFSISAIGVSGSLQLQKPKKKESAALESESETLREIKESSDGLEYGVKIQMAAAPYSKTKVVTIVPRFVLANNLDFPVVIRQRGSLSNFQYFKEKQEHTLFIKEHGNSEVEIELRAGLNTERENSFDQSLDRKAWSSAFCITDIQDLQVSIAREKRKEKHWSYPSAKTNFRQIIHVEVMSMDEATIFVCLHRPRYPDFTINNLTDQEIFYQQAQSRQECELNLSEVHRLAPKKQIPFTWEDITEIEKKIKLTIDKSSKTYSVEKIQKFKPFAVNNRTQYEVELKVKRYSRCLEVREKEEVPTQQLGSSILYMQSLINKEQFRSREVNLRAQIRGIGLSLVDNEPKELIYISLFKLELKVHSWRGELKQEEPQKALKRGIKAEDEQDQLNTQVDFTLEHAQIDDMLTDRFKVIFTPERIIQKGEKEEESKEDDDDVIPFIQVSVSIAELKQGSTKVVKYPALQVAIQRMILEVETQSVSQMFAFMSKLLSLFNQEKTHSNLSARQLKEKAEQSKQEVASVEQLCEQLSTSEPKAPVLKTLNRNKLYFEFIHFGAISIVLTLQIEPGIFELELNPTKGFGLMSVVYTLGTSIANISDASLSYHEMIITSTFSSFANIMDILTKKYIRHSVLQLYRIIGSSDLIGNPIGLVDKLGSGVFEFFNEPRKGLLKGPAEFVGGMGAGVTSLVTNVVSGSFNSVSKITGSLYGIAKNVTGRKGKRLAKPDHVFEGVFMGIKGGVSEIAHGITGIFTKPFQKAKKQGAKGFIKGVGAGLLGAVASPFTAMFRVGHSVASGVSNTATYIKRGKVLKQGRFRHPRYFSSKKVLLCYDDDISEAREILSSIKGGKYISSELKFFTEVERLHKKKSVGGTVIITESEVLLIENLKEVVFALPLYKIAKIGVFNENERYILYLWHDEKKKKHNSIEDQSFEAINKIYEVLTPKQ